MRTVIWALLLSAAATANAGEPRVFGSGSLPREAEASLMADLERRHVPAAGVLFDVSKVDFIDVKFQMSGAFVLLQPREAGSTLCRGDAIVYSFDGKPGKWESSEDHQHDAVRGQMSVSYFFKPVMKAKCNALINEPSILMGKLSDADLLGILDTVRQGFVERASDDSRKLNRILRSGRIIGITMLKPGTFVVVMEHLSITVEKQGAVWEVTDLTQPPVE